MARQHKAELHIMHCSFSLDRSYLCLTLRSSSFIKYKMRLMYKNMNFYCSKLRNTNNVDAKPTFDIRQSPA